ncbi:MAG: hypothetical protein PHG00_12595 [Methylococcales bacterium]|nr:hypothetical protein [Methylococcales bacterium]
MFGSNLFNASVAIGIFDYQAAFESTNRHHRQTSELLKQAGTHARLAALQFGETRLLTEDNGK